MSGSLPRRRGRILAGAEQLRYEKGNRVWVRGSRSVPLPGVVIAHHVDWNLYRVVYLVGIAGQRPRAVEEWRLSPRRSGGDR